MKVELNDKQKEQLKYEMDKNPIRAWLLVKDSHQFEVGDVLIKKMKRTDYHTKNVSWVTENINSDNKMSQRYVVINIDEFGIAYIKQLRVSNGSLGVDTWSLTSFDMNVTRFEVDPEYAETNFLEGDFDIKKIHAASLEARKLVTKGNRKIGVKFHTLNQANNFFANVKVGDTLWTTHDFTGRYKRSYLVESIELKQTSSIRNSWEFDNMVKKDSRPENKDKPKLIDTTDVYAIKLKGRHGGERYSFEFMEQIFYTIEPSQEEKNK